MGSIFRGVAEQAHSYQPPLINAAEEDLDISCKPTTKGDQERKLRKNGKTKGTDEILAEALKADTEATAEMLHPLFLRICEKEEVSADWKEGYLFKLLRK